MLDDKETHEVKLLLEKVHFALEFTSGLTRELDREHASQFNVFRYVRDDELGLSRIIADLLDPNAQHGQSVLFLREFLNLVCKKRKWNELDSRQIVVRTEHEIVVRTENKIPRKRCIDIWIRIGSNCNSDRFCLAFENKPTASDGENQLIDYLNYLKVKFKENFLLIYLAPAKKRPAESSLPRSEYQNWKNRLMIMEYTQLDEFSKEDDGNGDDAAYYQEFLCDKSLTDWLKSSKKLCDSDKLRRFLNDFENYCYERFGNKRYDNVEVRIMEKIIKSKPELVKSAYLVHQCWPSVVEMIGKDFLKLLHTKIKQKAVARRDDVELEMKFGIEANSSYIRLWKKSWPSRPEVGPIFYVHLINGERNFKSWSVGVWSSIYTENMKKHEKRQRDIFANELQSRIDGNRIHAQSNPGWKNIDNDKRDWQTVADRLISEVNDEDGELTKHYVNLFVEYAEVAVDY